MNEGTEAELTAGRPREATEFMPSVEWGSVDAALMTGLVLCDFGRLHAEVERLLQRPVLSHEYAFMSTGEAAKAARIEELIREGENALPKEALPT